MIVSNQPARSRGIRSRAYRISLASHSRVSSGPSRLPSGQVQVQVQYGSVNGIHLGGVNKPVLSKSVGSDKHKQFGFGDSSIRFANLYRCCPVYIYNKAITN